MSTAGTASTSVRITANEFFLGLFSALKLHGQESFSIRADRFDATIKEIFDRAPEMPGGDRVDLGFQIRPHEIYGDSRTVRRALTSAAQRRIISFDNPEYLDIRIQLDGVDAERKLQRIEAPDGFFEKLAEEFMRSYRKRRESPSPS